MNSLNSLQTVRAPGDWNKDNSLRLNGGNLWILGARRKIRVKHV